MSRAPLLTQARCQSRRGSPGGAFHAGYWRADPASFSESRTGIFEDKSLLERSNRGSRAPRTASHPHTRRHPPCLVSPHLYTLAPPSLPLHPPPRPNHAGKVCYGVKKNLGQKLKPPDPAWTEPPSGGPAAAEVESLLADAAVRSGD